MRLSDLDYDLPPELIAQQPLERRDEARMEVVKRKSGAIEHSRFYKLGRYLHPGDVCWCSTFPPTCVSGKRCFFSLTFRQRQPVP
jgi:S-adenosylmethionine:tRNA ribosyltransferase-isomerase